MRTIFETPSVQEQLKAVIRESGYNHILDYWDEFVGFFTNEKNVFSDFVYFLIENYHVAEEDAVELSDQVFGMCYEYKDQLGDFFKARIDDGESWEEEAEQFDKPVQGVLKQKPVAKASFYFSPEDEEEIRKISQQSTGGSQQKMEAIYERVADEIIERLSQSGMTNFQFSNKQGTPSTGSGSSLAPEQSEAKMNDAFAGDGSRVTGDEGDKERRVKRLKGIIISRLKDARDAFETKEALAKPWKIGGMEMSVEEAERIVKEVEKAREALGEELKLLNVAMRQSANAAMRDREIASSVRPPRKDIIGKQDLSIPEIEAPHEEQGTGYRVQGAVNKEQVLKQQSQEKKLPTTHYPLPTTSQRPAVDSVSSIIPPAFSKPKLMGPMEELSTMSLEDFRRLGNAADAVRKLNDKVELLAADSLLEKKKGLDAWKKSEVYKFYLIMGTESLEKKIGIAEVVALRKNQNQPTLTVEEFSAVADLNRKISFSN